MSGLLLRAAMCVPMYLFEHHLACDLVGFPICLKKIEILTFLNFLLDEQFEYRIGSDFFIYWNTEIVLGHRHQFRTNL